MVGEAEFPCLSFILPPGVASLPDAMKPFASAAGGGGVKVVGRRGSWGPSPRSVPAASPLAHSGHPYGVLPFCPACALFHPLRHRYAARRGGGGCALCRLTRLVLVGGSCAGMRVSLGRRSAGGGGGAVRRLERVRVGGGGLHVLLAGAQKLLWQRLCVGVGLGVIGGGPAGEGFRGGASYLSPRPGTTLRGCCG